MKSFLNILVDLVYRWIDRYIGQEGKKKRQPPSGVKLRHSDWESSSLEKKSCPRCN